MCRGGKQRSKREDSSVFGRAGEIGEEKEGETERGLRARQVISPLAASRRVSL